MTDEDERHYILKLNAFESGALLSMLHKPANIVQKLGLGEVIKQLIGHQKTMQRNAGVTKEFLPDGRLKMSDRYGNTVIREPFEWEKEGKDE